MPIVRILEEEDVYYRFTDSSTLGYEVELSDEDLAEIERIFDDYRGVQCLLQQLYLDANWKRLLRSTAISEKEQTK